MQEMQTFAWQGRDPGEHIAHPGCSACPAAEYQPWGQCLLIHEAQQADKKGAPPWVSDPKFQKSEAVSSGGARTCVGTENLFLQRHQPSIGHPCSTTVSQCDPFSDSGNTMAQPLKDEGRE